jgi:cytochrome c biogenesis protein ResB
MQASLLYLLLVLQIVAMICIIYESIQRYKADKKFWKQQEEISDEFLKQVKLHSELLEKGDVENEPKEDSSKE